MTSRRTTPPCLPETLPVVSPGGQGGVLPKVTRCPPDPRLSYRPDAGRWPEQGVQQELDPHESTPFAPRPSRGTRTRPTHTGGSEHDD